MSAGWTPTFGARLDAGGLRVRVCAPDAVTVRTCIEEGPQVQMARVDDGTFEAYVAGVHAGDRYRLQKDDHPAWPDPCSRWQPDGVHEASMVIDPTVFPWTDAGWRGVPRHRLVIYELHVGTFTPTGTFDAAAARLPELVDLGITAIELMPIAAFPGRRNWGYDGAALFAPSERYGHPDALRAFINRAHALGLAVLLDVVYNHLGPDGAYLAAWMPTIFTDRHESPWGRGINLDGPGSTHVRRLICDNALHWLLEYHFDGLRIDATHTLIDDSPEHLLAQLAREVAAHIDSREVHLIAEDERNLDTLLQPLSQRGYGLTGVWADDFHHAVRRHLAGDHEAWFADFSGSTEEIAAAVRDGWVYTGQHAPHHGRCRGTSPAGVPIEGAVICLQNHDQVGNRAHGERLHHQISHATWLAVTTLLLLAPETPLLFMGQEWAASSPFLFFTDHEPSLGELVVEGRRREFGRFSAFGDPDARQRIASPQAECTWQASLLRWEERVRAPHAQVLAQTRALLALRHAHLSPHRRDRARVRCEPIGAHGLWLEQPSALGGLLAAFIDLSGSEQREVPLAPRHVGVAPLMLHATSPAGSSEARLRVEGASLIFEATPEPIGVVLHMPGAAS